MRCYRPPALASLKIALTAMPGGCSGSPAAARARPGRQDETFGAPPIPSGAILRAGDGEARLVGQWLPGWTLLRQPQAGHAAQCRIPSNVMCLDGLPSNKPARLQSSNVRSGRGGAVVAPKEVQISTSWQCIPGRSVQVHAGTVTQCLHGSIDAQRARRCAKLQIQSMLVQLPSDELPCWNACGDCDPSRSWTGDTFHSGEILDCATATASVDGYRAAARV